MVSFDVFDTILVRALLPPTAVFQLLGRRAQREGIVGGVDAAAFARLRVAAEAAAVKRAGGPDARLRLEDIACELVGLLGLHRAVASSLADLERELEALLLRPCLPGVRLLAEARGRARRVVFVSDMYLEEEFVREQLQRWGLAHPGDRCYVSSTRAVSKQSGRMYKLVADEAHVPVSGLVHVGNDHRSDVRRARRAGVRTLHHLTDGNPHRYEALLAAAEPRAGGFAAALAGASRLTRLSADVADREREIVRVSAGVVAPVLTAFVTWTLRRAQESGVRRLYFVARDGQVLSHIARRLVESLGYEGEIRYLYGGRLPWNQPANLASDEGPSWVWDATADLSLADVLDRLRVRPRAVEHLLRPAGFPASSWGRPLTAGDRRSLRKLLTTPAVRAVTEREAARHRRMVIEYLRQEGVVGDDPIAMVDIGWSGSLHRALSRLVEGVGGRPPLGYYFDLVSVPESPRLETFLSEPSVRRRLLRSIGGITTLMEMFTAADHGTVLGYERSNGRVHPVLAESRGEPLREWGLPLLRRTIGEFLDHLVVDSDLMNVDADLQKAVVAVLWELWSHPTAAEADAWGGFPFEDGVGSRTYRRRLAEPYGPAHILPALFRKRGALRHRQEWPAACIALTPRPLRRFFWAAWRTRRLAWDLTVARRRAPRGHGLA